MIREAKAEANGPQRVAIYCRVSTDKQASKEDSSLDTQRDRLLRYIDDKKRAGQNWTIAYEIVEGEEKDGTRKGRSGKDLDRPGFSRLMEKVRARLVDIVVFTKIDRISRNVVDFLTLVEEFERYDVKLVSLKEEINTASASGRVMTTIMIALAQFEREQISERTREKMAWRAGKGLPIGPPPLGYEMHEGRYRPVPKEVEWVRFLDAAYLDTRSLGKVARMAFQKGIRSRNGRTLSKDAISRILHNPTYVGLISYNGETFKGAHEPIRDQATYRRILEALERPHGIILVTGPTGSGKTTTLYATLGTINRLEREREEQGEAVRLSAPGPGPLRVLRREDGAPNEHGPGRQPVPLLHLQPGR